MIDIDGVIVSTLLQSTPVGSLHADTTMSPGKDHGRQTNQPTKVCSSFTPHSHIHYTNHNFVIVLSIT